MGKVLTRTQTVSIITLLIIFLSMIFTDAQAASRRKCNRALVINEVTELNFGNFVGSVAGKVTISTSGARTTTGPILVGGGSVSPAVFSLHTTISGCGTYPVRVRFNRGTLGGPGSNMRVNNFTSTPASETFFLNPGANSPITVTVGADVSSAANQTNGIYTGTYRVRFNLRR